MNHYGKDRKYIKEVVKFILVITNKLMKINYKLLFFTNQISMFILIKKIIDIIISLIGKSNLTRISISFC